MKEELKALDNIKEKFEELAGVQAPLYIYDEYKKYDEYFVIIEKLLNISKKLPTAEEVCEKMTEWLDKNFKNALSSVKYDVSCFGFYYFNEDDYEEYIVQKTYDDNVAFGIHNLPLNLITLISRFYEGLNL